MPIYSTSLRYSRETSEFIIDRVPWWIFLVHGLIVDVVFAFLCLITKHRFCNHAAVMWAIKLRDRHAETFAVEATRERLDEYARWRGWRDWDEDDEEDENSTTTD